MLIHKVATTPWLEYGDKIVSAVARRDYVLLFTERGHVYKMVFDMSEQWEF